MVTVAHKGRAYCGLRQAGFEVCLSTQSEAVPCSDTSGSACSLRSAGLADGRLQHCLQSMPAHAAVLAKNHAWALTV